MTKVNGNSKARPSKKLEQLAELKYNYDLLTNELFHLKEYMSLIEFDPSYSNDTESYERFLHDEGLSLENADVLQDEYSPSSMKNGNEINGKVRRRQLRGSSASTEIASSLLADVEPSVRAKYDNLRDILRTGGKRKLPVASKVNVQAARKPSIPKLAQKRSAKQPENQSDELIPAPNKRRAVNEEDEKDILDQYHSDEDDSESDHFYFTTSSEDEPEEKSRSRRKRMRINLVVHPPRQTVTNPLHVIKPKFNNLHDFLDSFKSLDEDITKEEYEQYITEQRKIVAAIRKGLENGALKYDAESDSVVPITTKEARLVRSNKPDPISYFYKEQNLQTFQDHLINHGIHMSKLFHNSKKARIARARKVSMMIEQHFRHVAGAEERKAREEEKRKRALARAAIQAVKKRWTVAERAYRVIRKDEEEQIKRIKGKEHLSKMLEQSSQLLGAQLNQNLEEEEEEEEQASLEQKNSESGSSDTDDESLTSTSEEELHISSGEDDTQHNDSELKIENNDVNSSGVDSSSKFELLGANRDEDFSSENQDSESDSVTTEESSTEEQVSTESGSEDNIQGQSLGLGSLLEQHDDEEADSEEFVMSSSDQEMDTISENGDSAEVNNGVKEEKLQSIEEMNGTSHEKDSNNERDPLSVIDVPVPSLLRGTLRAYQKQGLNWMASLYNNNTNGILADEMGLGKTIQTISLLAYLACEKENWGPHLIIVPTSVLLNWEMELKRFAPGFKVLTYYGSPQQRKEKRRGWNKPDAFHICIVSYQLVVQDQNSFKRKKWKYMILDEAHNIKNFRSTRWQALLNFNTERRLLLTGTPLQNNIAELWSLLYFLMPQTITDGKEFSGFADLEAFQQWFGKPVDKVIEIGEDQEYDAETKKTVNKLHQVLRPYLLRRLKADVEKQMPAKYEHIVYCRLSKRQRFLYDDFMSRTQTKATLASGNFMSIVNCLMQLRKVCNHPDLFEVRPILTSFCMENSVADSYTDMNKFVNKLLHHDDDETKVNLDTLNLIFTSNDLSLTSYHSQSISKLKCINDFVEQVNALRNQEKVEAIENMQDNSLSFGNAFKFFSNLGEQKLQRNIDSLESMKSVNQLRCDRRPMYGNNLIRLLQIPDSDRIGFKFKKSLHDQFTCHSDIIENYAVITPNAVSLSVRNLAVGIDDESLMKLGDKSALRNQLYHLENPLHHLQTKMTIAFPDKSLLQYDCGKLQKLATLLQQLKDNGHRALLFTQMTKVLDILEQFLNYHGYLYMRLDGATKIEDRQILTERFNSDPRVTIFILSSRSGGLGINLTGADTVIFYDSDWNPAMDKQCQDRCHRIGQTRDVHIYRFVSEHTIESNILKKANQKRHLDNVVIQEGDFTTDYFTKLSVKDLLGPEVPGGLKIDMDDKPLLQQDSDAGKDPKRLEKLLAQAEDEDDVKAANLAMQEVEVDNEDFDEQKNPEHSIESGSSSGKAAEHLQDEYEGTNHVEEYMLRFIASGYYY